MALQKNLKTSLQMIDCSIFMQDVAPCHTAKSIKALLSASKVPGWQLNLLKGLKRELDKIGAARNLDELTRSSLEESLHGRKAPHLTNGDVTCY